MARRRFRWDPEKREMVELTTAQIDEMHFVRGDVPAFVTTDGVVIDSRTKYNDYCARRGVVPYEPGMGKEFDRYQQEKQDRQLRELLWEKVDSAMHRRR